MPRPANIGAIAGVNAIQLGGGASYPDNGLLDFTVLDGLSHSKVASSGTAYSIVYVYGPQHYIYTNQPFTYEEDWHDGTTGPFDETEWECRLTKLSGDDHNFGGLTINTWYTLSTTRTYGYEETGPIGFLDGQFKLEIREIAETANIIEATFDLYAEVSP